MMKLAGTLLVVVGFCAATVGAAGFEPTERTVLEDGTVREARAVQPGAWWLFLGGFAVFLAGVLAQRAGRRAASPAGAAGAREEELTRLLRAVRSSVVELDEARDALDAEDLRARADELLGGPFFDLTTRHEELVALLGFGGYAQVWEHVAETERRLSRFWSLATDGHGAEGMVEIPLARRAIERAAERMSALSAR